jgi:hypothetical protein
MFSALTLAKLTLRWTDKQCLTMALQIMAKVYTALAMS